MVFMSPEDADRHHQAHEVAAHDIGRLFDELSEDQLRAVTYILDGISSSSDPTKISGYLSGRATQAMQHRFKICAACNRNHEEELLNPPPPEPVPDDKPETPPHVEARRKLEANEVMFTPIGSQAAIIGDELALMHQYQLDDARDAATGKLLYFVCTGCEMQYQSIQDRMLKEPGVEGCSGCVQKAKWG